jgi:hypothetical protein
VKQDAMLRMVRFCKNLLTACDCEGKFRTKSLVRYCGQQAFAERKIRFCFVKKKCKRMEKSFLNQF